jgi:hypothetical protein
MKSRSEPGFEHSFEADGGCRGHAMSATEMFVRFAIVVVIWCACAKVAIALECCWVLAFALLGMVLMSCNLQVQI